MKWRFWIAIALQTVLIAAIPAQAIYTHLTGKTVILKTAPIDSYELMRGYSIALNYDFSSVDALRSLPGWKTLLKEQTLPSGSRSDNLVPNTTLYVILQAPPSTSKRQPWKLVNVSHDRPTNLSANQVALKGRVANFGRIEYGLETYYLPENQRKDVNQAFEQAQQKQESAIELKVDAQGTAVPIQIWVGDRPYRF